MFHLYTCKPVVRIKRLHEVAITAASALVLFALIDSVVHLHRVYLVYGFKARECAALQKLSQGTANKKTKKRFNVAKQSAEPAKSASFTSVNVITTE